MKKVGVISAPLAAALASSASTRVFGMTAGFSGGPQSTGTPRSRATALRSFLGQGLRARHQLDVFLPEALRIRGALDQLGGAARNLDAGQRPVAKDVAHAIAELIAHFRDPLVRRAAIGACVAAIFDQRDGGVRRTEDMVGLVIHRPIKPIARHQVRHAKDSRSGSP